MKNLIKLDISIVKDEDYNYFYDLFNELSFNNKDSITSCFDVDKHKRVYRDLAKKYHPDKMGSHDKFTSLNNAYHDILDEVYNYDTQSDEEFTKNYKSYLITKRITSFIKFVFSFILFYIVVYYLI